MIDYANIAKKARFTVLRLRKTCYFNLIKFSVSIIPTLYNWFLQCISNNFYCLTNYFKFIKSFNSYKQFLIMLTCVRLHITAPDSRSWLYIRAVFDTHYHHSHLSLFLTHIHSSRCKKKQTFLKLKQSREEEEQYLCFSLREFTHTELVFFFVFLRMGKKDQRQKENEKIQAVLHLLRKQAPLTLKQVNFTFHSGKKFFFIIFYFLVHNIYVHVNKSMYIFRIMCIL